MVHNNQIFYGIVTPLLTISEKQLCFYVNKIYFITLSCILLKIKNKIHNSPALTTGMMSCFQKHFFLAVMAWFLALIFLENFEEFHNNQDLKIVRNENRNIQWNINITAYASSIYLPTNTVTQHWNLLLYHWNFIQYLTIS